MSLLGREYLNAPLRSVGRRFGAAGEGPASTGSVGTSEPCYLLTQGSDGGWALVARQDAMRFRIRPLAPHGAATHVRARVAQAVAVRLLADRGVVVQGWSSDDAGSVPCGPASVDDTRAVFRAEVDPRG